MRIVIITIFIYILLISCNNSNNLAEVNDAPEFSFINQDGDTITQEYFKDKVYVVEFFFSTCPSICKTMNQNMVKIQSKFRNYEDFGIASFSVNPEGDTPEVLKAYTKKIGALHPHWQFLTGRGEKAIFDLATKKYFTFADKDSVAPGGFVHSDYFLLIDKKGKIRSRKDNNGNVMFAYHGTDFDDVQNLILDIKKLLKE